MDPTHPLSPDLWTGWTASPMALLVAGGLCLLTLYALLAAVAQGWREARMAESTQQILTLAKELDERLGTFGDHIGKLGGALGRAVDAYNSAVGSFETRLLPQARDGPPLRDLDPLRQLGRQRP